MLTRFAPSPTGPLHLGHAYSALTVWQVAARLGGTALLRIEDTDSTRVRPEHEAAIYQDLAWLGLDWPTPVRRQSDHYEDYAVQLGLLADMGLVYPCSCTRRQIFDAGATPGSDGMVYPGTCKDRDIKNATPGDAIRLNIIKALGRINGDMAYTEMGPRLSAQVRVSATNLRENIGDPVLQRKETGDPAYHLACVYDDALQGITHVVRGMDLQPLTPLHVLLQRLLGLPTPIYHHHALITDDTGRRLAKIDKSKALSLYRADGATPTDIRQLVGFKN